MAGHLTLSFRLMETRNLSDVFIRMSDSYPGPGHRRQFGEQSALTSTSPSNGIIEASTSGASCNQKDRQEKESGMRYMVPRSNHDSNERGDLDYARFRKRALFNRSLRPLRLRVDTSRIEAC